MGRNEEVRERRLGMNEEGERGAREEGWRRTETVRKKRKRR